MHKVKRISIGKGLYTTIDQVDWKKVRHLKLFASVETSSGDYRAYVNITVRGRETTRGLHRIILDCPSDMVVVHLDGDYLNNTRRNLVMCKRSAVKEIRSKIVAPKKVA